MGAIVMRRYEIMEIKKIEPPFRIFLLEYLVGLAVIVAVGIYGLISNKIFGDSFKTGMYFTILIVIIALIIYGISLIYKFRKYIVVKEFEVFDDRIIYKSAKGLKFIVRFEDVVVLFNVDATASRDREVPWVVNGLVFYNRKRKKYQEMRILKEDMGAIVNKYLEWCKKNSHPPAPVYSGKVSPSFKGSKVAKRHIKEFEERLKGYPNVSPPLMQEEDKKQDGNIRDGNN